MVIFAPRANVVLRAIWIVRKLFFLFVGVLRVAACVGIVNFFIVEIVYSNSSATTTVFVIIFDCLEVLVQKLVFFFL